MMTEVALLILYLWLATYSASCTIDVLIDYDEPIKDDVITVIAVAILGVTLLGILVRGWQVIHDKYN